VPFVSRWQLWRVRRRLARGRIPSPYDDRGRLQFECWYCRRGIEYSGVDPSVLFVVAGYGTPERESEQLLPVHAECVRGQLAAVALLGQPAAVANADERSPQTCGYCGRSISEGRFDPCAVIYVTRYGERDQIEHTMLAHANCIRANFDRDIDILDPDSESDSEPTNGDT
jgi:hypothetical protein